jgi:zinc transport system permease protein
MRAEDGPSWESFVGAWEIFADPMICALGAGLVLGFLSVYVVLRRMVFVSAAVTQAAALGVALSFFAEIHLAVAIDPILGAGLLSVAAIVALLFEPEKVHLTREAVLGWVFVASGGAAILVGDRIAQEAHDIQSIVFGTAVLVRPIDLWVILFVGATLLGLHLWWFRGISFAAFDAVAARVQGLPVRALEAFLLFSIALMVGASAKALGALPVFALSTLPAMAALLVGARTQAAFALAAVVGGVSAFGGYALAFFLEFPVGAAQTATAASFVVFGALIALGRRLTLR